METTLEIVAEEVPLKRKDTKEEKYVSFAEQYLEKPVYQGEGVPNYEMARFTATACTFRGVPIWDDF